MDVIMHCKQLVQSVYAQMDASHDYSHIERVLQNAQTILLTEPTANEKVVTLAVLLHDVSDAKYTETKQVEQTILQQLDLNEAEKEQIIAIIESVSFNGGNEKEAQTIEAEIVRDADRLDAIGAIGIARAFTYGGAKDRALYNDIEQARTDMSEAQYRNTPTATVTHFYEKLLRLKHLMCTSKGKEMAEERHQFMVCFLQQLQKERDGIV